mgnify:CR=1 FL=1
MRLPFLRNAETRKEMPKRLRTILNLWVAGTALVVLNACQLMKRTPPFDPRTSIEQIPSSVAGLQIVQGPRTERDIAEDMHSAYCNGQVLLKNMNEASTTVNPGTVTVRVTVEYTGEVVAVSIMDSEIESDAFCRKVADMIMDADFTPWARHDEDAVFIYPMTFTQWWD